MRFGPAFAMWLALAAPAVAQQGASLSELASTPVVTVRIGETLRAPPDQATINVTSQSRALTAAVYKSAPDPIRPKFTYEPVPVVQKNETSYKKSSTFIPHATQVNQSRIFS